MVLHNPNNWHWVNKDASPWARDFLEKELIGTEAEANGASAKIDKILSMDGDVDVSQRKGKVITLFDVKLQLEYSGKTADGEEASGKIDIPEVAHDTEEDEYVFDISLYSDSSSKAPVKDVVRQHLTPKLRKKLATLGPALINTHAKDLQHAADADPSKTFPAATRYQTSSSINKSSSGSATPAGSTSTSQTASGGASVNVTTVTDSEEFRTSADEVFKTFTDPQRIAAFTRAPPSLWEADGPAREGARFELFGGNVAGEYVELDAPRRIVQRWRLKQWPAGHYSRLELTMAQDDVNAVTALRVTWTGVPVGHEEATRRNWREYYVRSIKTTFGFGTIL